MAGEPWSPTLEEVAQHIPTRTRDTKTPGSDRLLGTFTASTTPSTEQAQAATDAAVLAILSATGPLDPHDHALQAQARAAAAWRAAADIEIAYPTRDADIRTYDSLDRRAKDELATLLRRLQYLGEGEPAALPVWSAPDPPAYADRDPEDARPNLADWLGGIDPGSI